MLVAHLCGNPRSSFATDGICPKFRQVLTRIPAIRRTGTAFNVDRLLNRLVFYPSYAQRTRARYDAFHVADHSYAQLVHALPAWRTGVFCHDLDTFRCLLNPAGERRPRWFRAMARRILAGVQKAAVVFHGTNAVREQLVQAGIVEADRLVLARYGVAPEFVAEDFCRPNALPWLDRLAGRPWVMHVGSTIPRKRVDLLLAIVAAARETIHDLALVKIGGEWSAEHERQIHRLHLGSAIVHIRDLSRSELAEAYRRAPVVLMPSDAEGFGLPVIEAMACGAPVIASDIAPLREAGGPAAVYAPVGDIDSWVSLIVDTIDHQDLIPARSERLAWSANFSWARHAETIASAYERILETSQGELRCVSRS